MDPAAGRRALYIVAPSRPATVHLGTAEVRGQFKRLLDMIHMLLNWTFSS